MFSMMIAGNLGRDAEFKTTQGGGEFCSFAVAAETGFGDRKVTHWVDVTRWGKGAEGLARILRKGSKVAVVGEFGLREANGKTYLQCRANDVTIMGTPEGGRDQGSTTQRYEAASPAYDLDSDIPF